MKYLPLFLLLLFPCSSFAQFPRTDLSQNHIQKFGITGLVVTIDSASKGYQLPYDTIKTIRYDTLGRILKSVQLISDVCYLHNINKYVYAGDSALMFRIRQGLTCPEVLGNGPDTTFLEETYEGGRLVTQAIYPWSNSHKLEKTKTYTYSQTGNILKERTIYAPPKKANRPGVVTYQRPNKLEVRTYDAQNRLSKIDVFDIKGQEQVLTDETFYTYKGNVKTEKHTFSDWQGNPQSRTLIYTYNALDQLIRKDDYRTSSPEREGSQPTFTTHYTYDERGLLVMEEDYKGNTFSYRFITHYQSSQKSD